VGMVNALGSCLDEIWARLIAGDQSCLSRRDDLVSGQSIIVGEVREPLPEVPVHLRQYDCRNNALSLAALQQIQPAVMELMETVGPQRIGVVVGSSTSGIAAAEDAIDTHFRSSVLPPRFDYRQLEFGGAAAFLAHYIGAEGPAYTVSTACSSSSRALESARS